MEIASITGTRPQFIKEAILGPELRKISGYSLINTGQHYDKELSEIFFNQLKISDPDFNLNVGSNTHGKQTAEIIIKIEEVLMKIKPELVIVYGDTNSTLAGAIAASKLKIPIAHVEAGMRSYVKEMPEEINRVVTDHLSKYLFCCTKQSKLNLLKEGITQGVYLTGDVMYDLYLKLSGIATKKSNILNSLKLKSGEYIFATIHRAKNTDNPERLRNIIEGMTESDFKIVFPIHPRTKKFIKKYGLETTIKKSKLIITEPLSYMDSLVLKKNAQVVFTDSGGVQKEAYFAGVPSIIPRKETEWKTLVNEGAVKLVDADKKEIIHALKNFRPRIHKKDIFGQGDASIKIAKIIKGAFS